MPKIALAQIEFKIANLNHHFQQIEQAVQDALAQNADIIIFPELALTGYFVGDLIEQPDFQTAHQKIFNQLLEKSKAYPIVIILGDIAYQQATQNHKPTHKRGKKFNVAYVLQQGEILLTYPKNKLPNDSVFDEKRYFKNNDFDMNHSAQALPNIADQFLWVEKNKIYHIHLAICEDLWHPLPDDYFNDFAKTPYLKQPLLSCQEAEQLLAKAAQNLNSQSFEIKRLIISLNASPFEITKQQKRLRHLMPHIEKFDCDIIYVNAIGMCDEVLFDGQSMILKHQEISKPQSISQSKIHIAFQAPAFKQGTYVIDWAHQESFSTPTINININTPLNINNAINAIIAKSISYAIKAYCEYTGFQKVVLGLSGGVDSALVAALASHALGAENVHAIMMPSPYTASISLEDAAALAKNLGISYQEISITALFEQYQQQLMNDMNGGTELQSIAVENLQARIRGQILMAYSNQNNALLLATGNKSELAMGYCTLYGDMAGGFAPIKDLYKTQVYDVCEYLNQSDFLGDLNLIYTTHLDLGSGGRQNFDADSTKNSTARKNIEDNKFPSSKAKCIPQRILTRAPSAELKANQTDQDSLPPYAVLDFILSQHIEHKQSQENILKGLCDFLKKAPAGAKVADGAEDDDLTHTNSSILFIEEVNVFAQNYLVQNPEAQQAFIQKYLQKIYQNEYKRRQGALGPRVNTCAFARDWRVPMTLGFRF